MGRTFIKALALFCMINLFVSLPIAEAMLLFHATKRAAARKIMQRGFSTKMMKPNARYGKGVYMSESKALALKEKPKAETVVVLKDSKMLQRYKINANKLAKDKLKRLSGDLDLRGNIHKGIIGPKLGRKIGKNAGRSGHTISYSSQKGKGNNIVVPKEIYQEHPRIVKPVKVIKP